MNEIETSRRPPRRARRWRVAAIGVLVVALVGMFGFLQLQSRRPVTLPPPGGPYPVGRALYDWTDGSRADPLSPGGHGIRELAVWAWYPAGVPGGARRAAYFPPAWQRAVQGANFLHTRADAVTTNSWVDVPVAGGDRPYPTLLFLPGAGRNVADYTSLAEDLASHGYAVFGVDPTYISDDVVLAQGRVMKANRSISEAINDPSRGKTLGATVIEGEAADLRFALSRVEALDQTAGQRFQGRLDTARIGFFGHSIGGAGAARACQLVQRCAGAVNLDGVMYGPVVADGLGKPFLFLGEDPSKTRNGLPTAALRGVLGNVPPGQGEVLTVTGTGHMNFSDAGVLYNFPPNEMGLIGPIDGARGLAITRVYLSTFFATYLSNQPSTLLSTPSRQYPEVHMARGF